MSHPFKHPRGKDLLKRVAQTFCSENTYFLRDSNIVFLCGGAMDPPTLRYRFKEYARTELPHLRIFLAEDAQQDYVTHVEPEFHKISEFEEIIGEVSDCVLLFPESPGSYAELGYFSKNEILREKLLIVNDATLQGQDSFIALGPIGIIDKYSRFKPTIQIQYLAPDFQLIKDRLTNRIAGKKRKKFSNFKYSALKTREKFFIIFELVNIFQALKFEEIEYSFRSIFGNVHSSELKRLLSILVAANLVNRRGDEQEYFCVNRDARSFMDLEELDIGKFHLEVLDFYEAHFSNVANVVKGLSE